ALPPFPTRRSSDLDLLEPELVDLVDDDEEHLVVLRPVGDGRLELEEFVESEIAAVGQGRRSHRSNRGSRSSSTRSDGRGARGRRRGRLPEGRHVGGGR